MERIGLVIASVCVAPLIAFAVLWTGILMSLFVMWLWYTGSFIPVSFLVLGAGYYLFHRKGLTKPKEYGILPT